jgi:hypothetical protein
VNPALLLVFLLLTPTQLREDKNTLEDEIDFLEKRIIEIEKKIGEKDAEINKKDLELRGLFDEYKRLKQDLRETDSTGNDYDALSGQYDESKRSYNNAIDQLEILAKDRKELFTQLSDSNLEFQLKTHDLENLEKIKPRVPNNWISITLSKTCQQLINANMSTNCPSYSQVVDVYDNTIPNISGDFIPTEFDVKREHPPIKESWKYYNLMMKGEKIIAVDPDAEFMQRSTIVEIQSNDFTTHSLFGSHVVSFVNGTIPIYKNIKISDSCDTILTAPDFESVAYAVQVAKSGCMDEIKPSAYIIEKNTKINRSESAWYQFESWLKEMKEKCLMLC